MGGNSTLEKLSMVGNISTIGERFPHWYESLSTGRDFRSERIQGIKSIDPLMLVCNCPEQILSSLIKPSSFESFDTTNHFVDQAFHVVIASHYLNESYNALQISARY